MSNEPTKTTGVDANGVTVEFEAKHSVELTNAVKDGWRVSGVKVYAMNATDAAKTVIEAAEAAEELLRKSSLNALNPRKEA